MKKNKGSKRNKAVALSYKKGYNAPKILAKGKGVVADNILKIAEKNKVKIVKNDDLVENLMELDLYEEIPPKLYEAVANIIYFIHTIDNEKED